MRRHVAVTILVGVIIAFVSSVQGAEYFVNKQGSDTNNGANRGTAFLTIQKGVDALQPGDTLTIGPGEYSENVLREDIGSMDVDTIIRAEVPGTAILRGDIPAPEFKKVDGYRFVYAAELDRAPQAVLEHHNLFMLFPKANIAELEFDPGFFHYDANSKILYISNPDLVPPDQRRYTLAMSEVSGLRLHRPKRVIIDGLGATGFYPAWGILLGEPVSCTVRNCVCFMNVGGIVLEPIEGLGNGDGGSNNVVENCVAYGNSFGGIVRYGANNDVIRKCHTYRNVREDQEHFGVMHYSTMTGPLLYKDNISWGHNFNYSVKQGNQQERLENCVGLGYIRISPNKMSHNLISGGNEYDRQSSGAPADTVLFARENDLDEDFEYADPMNLDYRLQPDSRFRGTAPDGSDRGPYPYEPNIFYVSHTGNDQADGLSMRTPWRTLARALSNVRPGAIIYMDQGKYAGVPLNKAGDGESPIKICARGRGTVIITGMGVTDGNGIIFERLDFSRAVALEDSSDIAFKNCTFYASTGGLNATNVKGLKITHSLFARVQMHLKETDGVLLSGNIYANTGKPGILLDTANAIRYSDYNDYQDATQCWDIDGTTWSFADLQKHHDRYSQTLAPKFTLEHGVPRVRNSDQFQSLGPADTALGIHHEHVVEGESLKMVGPFVHSVSDTTANIEWWTTKPANFDLSWGESPDMGSAQHRFNSRTRFCTYSLTGLKPGKTYYFKIFAASVSQRGVSIPTLRPENATLAIKTARKADSPRTYFVAPTGNDGNTGLSREQAFKTVCRAAAQTGPGDTVIITEGDYNETIRIRAAGTPERPITFRCATGEKAVIRGEDLERSFELIVKPDHQFDGLYFRGQTFWREGFVIRKSPRVKITRCLNTMVSADESPEMLVKNSILHGGWTSLGLGRSPNSVVENNVFIMTILRQISCGAPNIVRRNIFCECIRGKAHQQLNQLSGDVTESDNCFHLRWPENEKLVVGTEDNTLLTLPEWRVRTGSNSIAANPMMPGTPGWRQGWQQSSDEDFDVFFSTNPELIVRDIGLQPEAFSDFTFGDREWVYTRAWAETFLRARNAASAHANAGRNSAAVAAYTAMVEKLPMSDRLKSDVLEQAFLCAGRMKDYDRAMELAKEIPTKVISMRRQMQLMVVQNKYAELVAAFNQKTLGGRNFHLSYIYPELEDVAADLYYYRAQAYIHTGNLAAAEADLTIMNDKRKQLSYRCGEAIHDLTSLRLGDFYRKHLKDENRALEEYLKVCNRTTWSTWGTPPKPVLTGASETLVKATQAACEILRKQGKLAEVKKWQDSLKKAQADAAAALRKQ